MGRQANPTTNDNPHYKRRKNHRTSLNSMKKALGGDANTASWL